MPATLEQITVLWIFQFFLVFARMGSIIMLFPGIGERNISARIKLMFALPVSLLVLVAISDKLPTRLPSGPTELFLLLLAEIVIGVFIGSILRALLSIIHTTGMIIAFQSGLAAAMLFDVSQGSQGSVVGNYLTQLALILLFVSGMHHIVLTGATESYHLFQIGVYPAAQEMSEMIAKIISDGFNVAFKLAAPVVVITLMMYLGAGVMARVMPTMQIFFVLLPIQIYIAFFVLMATLSTMMLWYLNYFNDTLGFLERV